VRELQILTDRPNTLKHFLNSLELMEIDFLIKQKEDVTPGKVLLLKYSRILPACEISRIGFGNIVNFHNAKLPEYKGLNCPSWAIQSGDLILGATLHEVEPEVDSGGILAEKEIPLSLAQDVNDFQEKLFEVEKNWLPQQINLWISDKLVANKVTGGSLYPAKKDENFISEKMSVFEVRNMIRAVNPPYGPGVKFQHNEGFVRLAMPVSQASRNFLKNKGLGRFVFRAIDGDLELTRFEI
jgi:methionyl-tRNA formyltransferase